MEQITELVVPSFAKINWVLRVFDKRDDGYHGLETIYQTIDLRDEIAFKITSDSMISLRVCGREVARGKDNIVYKAAELLKMTTAVNQGVEMHLKKHIPIGAGLGGGSGNAAVVLLVLNKLWECGLSKKELSCLASQLGSDVPFFLFGGTALGLERGEEVIPCVDQLQEQRLLLFYPDFQLSTRKAYSLLKQKNHKKERKLTEKDVNNTMQRLHETISQKTGNWSFLQNDFEDVLFERYPVLDDVRRRLIEAGCGKVMLCGSGSTLLALGVTQEMREMVESILRETGSEGFFCQTLSRERYTKFINQSVHLI